MKIKQCNKINHIRYQYESKITELQTELTALKLLIDTNQSIVPIEEAKGCIFHRGLPPGTHECSKCRHQKPTSEYNYYQQRVDKNGYLMRSNALCHQCNLLMNNERKNTLKRAKIEGKIPPKPNPGDICTGCNRNWGTIEQPRNWHRDHDAIKNEFRGWLCADCNMAKHDHRFGIS
jgi:hypothetical protein